VTDDQAEKAVNTAKETYDFVTSYIPDISESMSIEDRIEPTLVF
jgi:hypothetical protein